MTARDYSWLKEIVAATVNRTDLAARIPDWIAFGEDDIEGEIANRKLETTLELDGWEGDLSMPSDLRQITSLTIDGQDVTYVGDGGFDTIPDNQRGLFYATSDTTILLHDARGDAPRNLKLRYVRGVCHLSDQNKSDWLQCLRPSARLYAALVHSAPYLEDDQRIGTWRTMYQQQIDGIESAIMRQPVSLRAEQQFLGVRRRAYGGRPGYDG